MYVPKQFRGVKFELTFEQIWEWAMWTALGGFILGFLLALVILWVSYGQN